MCVGVRHVLCVIMRPEACSFIKKGTLAQVFACEFCEISKSTFFTEYLWATASNHRSIDLVDGAIQSQSKFFFCCYEQKSFAFRNMSYNLTSPSEILLALANRV